MRIDLRRERILAMIGAATARPTAKIPNSSARITVLLRAASFVAQRLPTFYHCDDFANALDHRKTQGLGRGMRGSVQCVTAVGDHPPWGMFRDPGVGIRGMATAASVELIAVGLVHGCVDLVGVCSRNLVREQLPVGGVAGAIDVRLRVAKPGAGQGFAAVQGRLFPGVAQERKSAACRALTVARAGNVSFMPGTKNGKPSRGYSTTFCGESI